MIFDVKRSDEPTCIGGLQNMNNTCYGNYALSDNARF